MYLKYLSVCKSDFRPVKLIRIMIVDDHQVVIDGIQAMLRDVPTLEIVGQARSGEEALAFCELLSPDVMLLDISMPDMDGLEVCEQVSREFPNIHILMLSMLREYTMVRKAREKGASGYVLKNEGKEALVGAIKKVAGGGRYLSRQLSSYRKKHRAMEGPRISRREKEVLQLIVQECTAKEIAQKLFISENTVHAHRKNLLMKLEVKNTAGLVRVALRYGLLEH